MTRGTRDPAAVSPSSPDAVHPPYPPTAVTLPPDPVLSRRQLLGAAALAAAGLSLPRALRAAAHRPAGDDDRATLAAWVATLRREGLAERGAEIGRAVARAGELALGAPYAAGTLDAYLADGDPTNEPLVLTLARFDCVTLVEACVAVARVARAPGAPTWEAFARETERMRYRGGVRIGYVSRLHYFSEWIVDGGRRGLVRDLGARLEARDDARPLRFMTEHRSAYAALKDDGVFARIGEIERGLDAHPRHIVSPDRIPAALSGIRTGDVLAFATSIAGLDATHTGLAYRDRGGVMRVLHAPLAGGEVQVSRGTLPEYVAGLRNNIGILVARPLDG